MTFSHTVFLYFLPAAVIPLIIALVINLNRKQLEFPSLILIHEMLKKQLRRKRLTMRVKQVLRMVILLLLTLGFSAPIISPARDTLTYTVVIDPTISMKRFNIAEVIRGLEQNFNIEALYFGRQKLSSPQVIMEEQNFSYDDLQFSELLLDVLSGQPTSNLILVTDGQRSNFENQIKLPSQLKRIKLVLLSDNNRNIYLKKLHTFPMVSIQGLQTRILAELSTNLKKGDRVQILLNDVAVVSEQAQPSIETTRYIESGGITFGEVRLEGDGFPYDNSYYFPVISIPTPTIYFGIDSPILHRIVSALFPKFYRTANPDYADVIIGSSLSKKYTDKPVFLFCDSLSSFEATLRQHFAQFVQFNNRKIIGDVTSDKFPILNIIRGLQINTRFQSEFGQVLCRIDGVPLAYQIDNIIFFNFSIAENQESLSSSVFLLLLINEVLMRHYAEKYLLTKEELRTHSIYYDLNGNIASPVKPGIYRHKESGKYLVINTEQESLFEFLSPNELSRYFNGKAEVVMLDAVTGSPRFHLSLILILLAIALLMVEML